MGGPLLFYLVRLIYLYHPLIFNQEYTISDNNDILCYLYIIVSSFYW